MPVSEEWQRLPCIRALVQGLAGGAVLVVCWLLTGSLWASALMVAVIAMVLLDMAGAMFLAGIQLNAVRPAAALPSSCHPHAPALTRPPG